MTSRRRWLIAGVVLAALVAGWIFLVRTYGIGRTFLSGFGRYVRQRVLVQNENRTPQTPRAVPTVQLRYETNVVATGLIKPTRLAIHPVSGQVYVSELGGTIYRLGSAGDKEQVAAGFKQLLGISFEPPDGQGRAALLVASRGTVSRLQEQPDGQYADRTDLVTGLPAGRHQTDLALVGPDDQLYVATGSRSDHGEGGIDSREAAILVADRTGGNLQVFARGLRNPYAMAFEPHSGDLYVTDNGQDVPNDGVPDELNLVKTGGNFGWPTCWGTRGGDCGGTILPLAELQEHSSADGFDFVPPDFFSDPADLDILVALYGSNSRDPEIGKRVQRISIRSDGEGQSVQVSDFLTNLANPIDVKWVHDALYVLDFGAGQVLRITATAA